MNYNKDPDFMIEDTGLFLEQSLIYLEEMPFMFVCVDDSESERYLVLCSDMENDSYVIIKPKLQDLVGMIKGNIPMRDIFLSQKFYWSVSAGSSAEKDVAEKKTISEIDEDILPSPGKYFNISNGLQRKYCDRLSGILLSRST